MKTKDIAWFFLPFIVLIIFWESAVQLGFLNPSIYPAPSQVASKFIELLQANQIQNHVYSSILRVLAGYGISIVIGVSVGLILGMNQNLSKAFNPILSLLISIPTIAWVPLLLVVTGLGTKTIVLSVFLGGFFAISYNTMNGIRSVKKNLVNSALISGADKKKIFFDILLPASLTSIIPGLRLGIGYSWRALVGAEMLASKTGGLGRLIYGARSYGGVEEMLVGLAVIGILAFITDRVLMGTLEKKTIEKWGMVKKR